MGVSIENKADSRYRLPRRKNRPISGFVEAMIIKPTRAKARYGKPLSNRFDANTTPTKGKEIPEKTYQISLVFGHYFRSHRIMKP
jgi:hypothetical protein